MSLVRDLLGLLEAGDRRRLGALVLAVAAGSALEAIGIGLVLPYLEAVTRPADLFRNPETARIFRALGLVERDEIVLWTSLALVAVFVLKNVYVGWQWRTVFGFLYRRSARLSRRLLEGYLRAPYTFHLTRNSSELVRNAMEEPQRLFGGAFASLLVVGAEGLVILGLVGVLLLAHTAAAAVLLGLLAAFGWGLAAAFRRRMGEAGRARAREQSRLMRAVRESLGGFEEVRLRGREASVLDRFSESAEGYAEALRQERVVHHYPRLVLETGAVVVMIGLAGFLVFTGVDVVGAIPVVGVFGIATVRLMPSVHRVVDNVNHLRFQAASVEIVRDELRRLESGEGSGSDARSGARRPDAGIPGEGDALPFERELAAQDLTYVYGDAPVPAVRDVSFRLARGEWLGIVGPSGAGKTTLVHLLLGFLEPDRGRIAVDGRDVREALSAWQRKIGYIPQETFLTDDSVARNVALGLPDAERDEERVWRALESAQLAGFVRGLEEGLGTPVGERGVRLSGGQRQRVAIARALYHDPEVLVLDEATSSLDYETEARILETVGEIAGERTLVMVTHRVRTVRKCDRIHLLREGRIEASGGYDALLEGSERFRRLARAE